DERTKAHCEEERRVPGGCDRRLRQVEPVAEIADDGAGTAADGLGDVTRSAGGSVDPDQRERSCSRRRRRSDGLRRSNPPQAEPEDEEPREVDDEAAAV